MKQPKKLETRRHKAIRRTLIFLAAVVLAQMLSAGRLLPSGPTRYAEAGLNCGYTKVVEREYVLKKGLWQSVFFLTENENATIFTRNIWYPLYGWMGSEYAGLDCSEPRPIYVGRWNITFSGEYPVTRQNFAYGRVDDPDIAALEIVYEHDLIESGPGESENWTEKYRQRTQRADWKNKEGRAYFTLDFGTQEWEENSRVRAWAYAYDGNGTLLGRYEAEPTSWSTTAK